MKVVILAGGLGTRISEETDNKPKPMVLIDDKPIIWHLMNIFASQGFSDFVIATGYKSEVLRDWISELDSDWNIQPVDTGLHTQTGGRIKQCMKIIGDEPIIATYGDGLANVNINQLIHFHEINRRLATVTAVRPPARFGVLETENGVVRHFGEKNQTDAGWINGGFFVLEPGVADYIHNDAEPLETGALPRLVAESNLSAYHHNGFWKPMDTLREKQELQFLSKELIPPWIAIL